jgi:hypothetical protein
MDGDEARRAAARLRSTAEEVRSLGDRASAAGSVAWQSIGADAFRRRLADTADRVGGVAALLDEAADALRRHAEAVDASPLRAVLP